MCPIISRNSSNVCLPGAPPISVYMPGCVWRSAELLTGHGMTGPSLHMSSPSPGPAVVPGVAWCSLHGVSLLEVSHRGLSTLSRAGPAYPGTYIQHLQPTYSLQSTSFKLFDQVTPSPSKSPPHAHATTNLW